jgi:H+/Cl- antiporter ClcA
MAVLALAFRALVDSGMQSRAEPGSGLKQEEVKRRHILPKALVIGLVAGLISSAFCEALQWSERQRAVAKRLFPTDLGTLHL